MSATTSSALDTRRLVAARLDRDQSLSLFRSMLAALSRPGLVVQMDAVESSGLASEVPPVLRPALALADLDQRVAVLDAEPWANVVAAATGAVVVDDVAVADIVVALRPPTGDELDRIRVGTHAAPESGARVFLACRELIADPEVAVGGTVVAVRGPGAALGRRVAAVGLDAAIVDGIRRANADFPAGFDTWLVGDDATIVGLPRSVEIA